MDENPIFVIESKEGRYGGIEKLTIKRANAKTGVVVKADELYAFMLAIMGNEILYETHQELSGEGAYDWY